MSEVRLERGGEGVVVLTLDRPEARNALSPGMREELTAHFTALAQDADVRVVVLSGGTKVFAAGADLRTMAEASPSDMMRRGSERFWGSIRNLPQPLIAAVEGWALGGGCELAMHADIIVAGEGARFGQPEIKVGIMPGSGGTQRLVRAVGKFKAMRMLLTGEPVTAAAAEAMGLVSEIVPEGEALGHATELARSIAALPPLAARKIKEVVLAGADQPLDAALLMERQAFQLLFDTADQKEGMAAFLEKRKPDFKGR
ncbi:enoyl-CoA hydratase-related protein [Jiella sonneratiae]|uniref:Enoyl-CoA hydratase/isomerase family protein n=1 Tax=Jiella sonneratiae TaxID=2816856 RepID=A0ABS3IZJ1_9HYPH|nr:enoyl-CoA hydratase-related protein [Jiella sonneratiae]MBO0902242.1 enoyl-CoA hydratase/isomerase family protein [Jiella sonneratiae]